MPFFPLHGRSVVACFFVASLGSIAPALSAQTTACNPLPAINPKLGFVANFNNPCYAISLASGNGVNSVGDLNATYNQTYYTVPLDPNTGLPLYELVLLGVFPNTRFFSVTADDEHLVDVAQLVDTQILPLNALSVNPLLPGATFVPNQQYGITVTFGGGAPATVTAGCSTSNSNIDKNVLDASMIHQGDTWTGYPGLPPTFPPHQTGANSGGAIQVRKYVDIATPSAAVVIVRQLSDGCALPAAAAYNVVVNPDLPTPNSWVNESQINDHGYFAANIQPRICYRPQDPHNAAMFFRTKEYVPLPNGASASVTAQVDASDLQTVFSGLDYMRVRFQLPTTPTTPCVGGACSFTGNEQQRYKSLSFQFGNNTILSLKDSDFVTDPNGNVALIVGVGPAPTQVTAANYYTYVDISTYPNYQNFQTLFVRDILPNASFDCSSFNVPFKTEAYFPLLSDGVVTGPGGYMGTYNMTVDFTPASEIPVIPVPPNRTNTCTAAPPAPVNCPAP